MIRAAELRRWLGVQPPPGLLGCLEGLSSWSGGNRQQLEDGLDEVFGVSFATGDHVELPAEVFPFLQGGEAFERYAYVVWAPELPASDHPVVRVDGSGRLHPYAPDTPSAFRRLLVEKVDWDEELDERLATQVFRAMGLPEEESLLEQLRAPRPPGWSWVPTLDGVGVVAPRQSFDPRMVRPDPERALAEHQHQVNRWLTEGRPASALQLLKDACHLGRSQPGLWTRLGSLMAEVYLELGRADLAASARRRSALKT